MFYIYYKVYLYRIRYIIKSIFSQKKFKNITMPNQTPQYLQIEHLDERSINIPDLPLTGPWLRDLGFCVGTFVSLSGFGGRLVIELVNIVEEKKMRMLAGMSAETFDNLLP